MRNASKRRGKTRGRWRGGSLDDYVSSSAVAAAAVEAHPRRSRAARDHVRRADEPPREAREARRDGVLRLGPGAARFVFFNRERA